MTLEDRAFLDPNKKLPKRPEWLQDTIKAAAKYEKESAEHDNREPKTIEDERFIYCLHCCRVYPVEEFEKNYAIWKEIAIKKGFKKANKLPFCPGNRLIENEKCNGNPIDFFGWSQCLDFQKEGEDIPKEPPTGYEWLYYKSKA